MPDREKVIKGLEHCAHTEGYCDKRCPYWDVKSNCGATLKRDALALLKAQTRMIEQFECEREQRMWDMPPMGGFHDD